MAETRDSTITGRRWEFAWCAFDEISQRLTVHDRPVRLERKPLEVLTILLERPAETVGKEELLEAVWENTTEQSLVVAISKLRKAFGGERDAILMNVAGVGYRMAVPVVCTVGVESAPPPFEPEPGKPIPGRPEWVVLRRLGREVLGPVWLARHRTSGEQRVFKFATDGVHLRALQREVMVARLLEESLGSSARWFVRILDRAFAEPPFFIGSEYGGVDLREWFGTAEFANTGLEGRIRLAAEIADAVAAAHALGVLHNDLKPGNILVTAPSANTDSSGARTLLAQPTPGNEGIKIADFGVASMLDPQRLRDMDITDYGVGAGDATSTPVGTIMYRAPELVPGQPPTALADVYALGVLLYQIATGDSTHQLSPGWEQRIADPLLRQDIGAAAHVDPAQRLSSAAELASRLHQIEAGRAARRQFENEREQARRAGRLPERARARRPWIVMASAALIVGLCVSLALYRNALGERNRAQVQQASLEKMYAFVARDLLGQSNPFLNVPGASVPGQTLLDAIRTALPRIDQRFASEAEVAGHLHATIADAFRARAQYGDAEAQYAIAAQRFRQAGGELSPEAAESELNGDDTRLVSLAPGAIEAVRHNFVRQQALIARMRNPPLELRARAALVEASLTGLGPAPADGLPSLQQTIREASSVPGFDPLLLITLRKRVCGIYLRMGDGANVVRTARELIRDVSEQYGPDSPNLAPLEMYVQEGLYLQGSYRKAITQADSNFVLFSRMVGPRHELTLATLANRAASEGQLGLYFAAAQDDLKLYTAELSLAVPSRRFEMGSLADAATYECHGGHFRDGANYARQVMRQAAAGPQPMTIYATQATFTLAECEIAEVESAGAPSGQSRLREAERLLKTLQTKPEDPLGELPDLGAKVQLAWARIALIRHDSELAGRFAEQAAPTFLAQNADFYEKSVLARVEAASKSLHKAPRQAGRSGTLPASS